MRTWIWLALQVAGFATLVSLVLCRVMIAVSHRFRLVDVPGERKLHTEAQPITGGVAILGAFLVTIGVHLAGVWLLRDRVPAARLAADALEHSLRAGEAPAVRRMAGILAGGLVVFLLGAWDDRRPLGPFVKLAVQSIAAGIAYAAGVRLDLFLPAAALAAPVTILWILLITNAFNLLDNMDGLSGGVAAIAAALFAFIALTHRQTLVAGLLAAYIGSVLGFLWYNRNPARLFMGDAGALFLGFVLACVTVATSFYVPGYTTRWVVVMPVLILGVPLFDTASVVFLRRRAGAPIMRGDQRHFSHRLVRLGFSQRQAVLLIYLVSAVVGLGATQLTYLPPAGAVLVLLQGLGIFAVVGFLEWAGGRAAQRANGDGE